MNWLQRKLFRVKTGNDIVIANGGKPVEELVIKHGNFYFGIDLDARTGEPTGGFGWSRDPSMFPTVTLRDIYIAEKKNYDN